MNMLSLKRPLPSMLILTSQALRTEVNASLVNWHPWSVLKISGAPYLSSASFSASTQNLVSRVLDSRQDRSPVHYSNQIHESFLHRYVGNVRRPDLVRAVNGQPSQQIRVDRMFWLPLAGAWFRGQRLDPHDKHQTPDSVAADRLFWGREHRG